MVPDDIADQSSGFSDLLISKFADSTTAQTIVEQYIAQPDIYEGALVEMLEEEGITRDTELIDAARTLLETMDVRGATRGHYTVDYDDQDLEHFV